MEKNEGGFLLYIIYKNVFKMNDYNYEVVRRKFKSKFLLFQLVIDFQNNKILSNERRY